MLGDIVRAHIAILALALVAFLSACGTSPEQKAACDELAEMACDFTPDEFLDAAEYGDTKTVRLFLVAGMNPNVKNSSGITSLIYAAMRGHTEVVKALLDHGAEVMGQETPGQKGLYAKSKCSGDTLNRIKLED